MISLSLPLFQHWPDINFIRKRRLWLRVQIPVRIRDLFFSHQLLLHTNLLTSPNH